MTEQEWVEKRGRVMELVAHDVINTFEQTNGLKVIYSFAVPRNGCQFAARVTFQLTPTNRKHSKPITLWTGVVNERTFERERDARKGIFGFVSLGYERAMKRGEIAA